MPNFDFLVPLEPGPCIAGPTEFMSLIAGSSLVATAGMIYVSATAPDVITYPMLKTWLWLDTSGDPVTINRWDEDSVSWINLEVEAAASAIADLSVTLAKLSPAGGNPGDVVRQNSGGTALIFDSPQNLFTTLSRLNISVLSLSAVGDYIMASNGVTNFWVLKSTLIAGLTTTLASIDVTGALSNQVIGYLGGTTGWRYIEVLLRDATTPFAKLANGTANNLLGWDSGGVIASKTPASVVAAYLATKSYNTPSGSRAAIPAATDAQAFAHGLAAEPMQYGGWIVCTDVGGDGTFAQNDKILWTSLYTVNGDESCNFSAIANNTSLILSRPSIGAGAILTPTKDGSAHNAVIDASKWLCGGWVNIA